MTKLKINFEIDLAEFKWYKRKGMFKNSRKKYTRPCIYILRHHTEVVYVGQTKNLKNRINDHLEKTWNAFGVLLVEDEAERLMKETALIKHFTPHYNVLCNATPSDIPLSTKTTELQSLMRKRDEFRK